MNRAGGNIGRLPVVIDSDLGVDDALAVLLALRSPEIEVVGITTVCGNVAIDQATLNLYRVLEIGKARADILIGCGASRPLRRPLETATHVHGSDGLGEVDRFMDASGRPQYPQVQVPRRLPTALSVWDRCLRRYPRDLHLITLGPLTNVAVALDRRPQLVRRFRSIVAMAGAIAVPGNVTAAAEFNVYVDPEAAARVIDAKLPLTLVPLDVTTQVCMTREQVMRMTSRGTDRVCRFVGNVTERALAFAEHVEGQPVFLFHDPLAVAVILQPSLVRSVSLHVAVETHSDLTRGATIADRRARSQVKSPVPNARVVMQVDARRSLRLIKERLCRRSSSSGPRTSI